MVNLSKTYAINFLAASLAASVVLTGCGQAPENAELIEIQQPAMADKSSDLFEAEADQALASAAERLNDDQFAQAFDDQADGVQLKGSGEVITVLPDDNKGSRHQKFLVRLSSGQTLLVAHNIDLAPRVADLSKGDQVSFYGEYVWTPKGGVMHWTHHDPAARHQGGWIEKDGIRYE